eukprot:3273944-Pyramimonas_sp.AAC.1
MGDGNACELFVRSFLRPVEAWRDELLEQPDLFQVARQSQPVPLCRAANIMTCALTNVMHDVSVRDYADDIHQT